MAKLTKFVQPFSGKEYSLTDIGGLWSMILGVFVMFFVFSAGQNIAGKVSSRVPAIDTTIEPVIASRTVSSQAIRVV